MTRITLACCGNCSEMPESAAIRGHMKGRAGNLRTNRTKSCFDLLNQGIACIRTFQAFHPGGNGFRKPSLSFTAHAKPEETFRCFWKSLDDHSGNFLEGIQF